MDNQLEKMQLEIAKWHLAGKRPRVFVRDDDAIDVTPALIRLKQLMERRAIPVLLAVIPKFATPTLGDFVKKHSLITPAVHGWAHTNHAFSGGKKCEFGDERSNLDILADFEQAREKLTQLFGSELSGLFVPPWNRMSEKAIDATLDAGFRGISGFGWRTNSNHQKWINTHVDVIDWKTDKTGKPLPQLLAEVTTNLQMARERNFAPIGILLHHLVHGANLWQTLEQLFEHLENLDVEWIDEIRS